jgi:hypothetical protein
MQWFIHDPYAVTIVYRVLTVLVLSVLVLAILRRLLSPGIAWALAVWWAILPVNFDDLYEVHLFGLVPLFVAILLASSFSGLRARGTVFGVLLGTSLLMRNETIVAAAIWLLVWLLYEWRREGPDRIPARSLVRAIAIPVLAVVLIGGLVVLSDPERGHLRAASQAKNGFNTCQIYAYGYQQRHDDFAGDPWRDCGRLMERDFGRPAPTLLQATTANPGAMAGHFLWNVQLSPAALQLLLFDRMSAGEGHNPDYIPVKSGSAFALVGSLLVLAFSIGGLTLLWRDRDRWRRWIEERAWGWLALLAVGASDVAIMILARPRPEFVFSLTVLLLAVIGMAAMAYVARWPAVGRLGAFTPLFAIALVIGLPSHYGPDYQTPLDGRPGRPVKATVDHLQPFSPQLHGGDVGLLATYGDAACHYLGREDPCRSIGWPQTIDRQPGESAEQFLDSQGIRFIYVDNDDMQTPQIREVVGAVMRSGWQRVGPPLSHGWTLLRRASITVPNAKTTSSAT